MLLLPDKSSCSKAFYFLVVISVLTIFIVYFNAEVKIVNVQPYKHSQYVITEEKINLDRHIELLRKSSTSSAILSATSTTTNSTTPTTPTITTSTTTIITTSTTTIKSSTVQKKLILVYTSFFGDKPWPYYQPHKDYTKKCGCDFVRCELTYDRNRFSESDAVLFHGRDMPSLGELENLMKIRNPKQRWVYFVLENPYNSANVQPLDKYFNWSITYRLASDVQMPYRWHKKLTHELPPDHTNYALGKTKQVAWFVGHCGTLRDQLARKLEDNGITIAVAGGCAGRFNHRLACPNRECTSELLKYKFYYAAENNLCEDYITEKYWDQGFRANAIPIVLGGSNYSNPKLAIPGSFIDAMSFKTPKHLADHLKEIDQDDRKFNEYFKWKTKWKLVSPPNGCEESLCNLCTKLNDDIKSPDKPLASYISTENCRKPENYFRSWINS